MKYRLLCLGGRTGLKVTLALAAALPVPALAQTGLVVQGRVVESGGDQGVPNALVELEGYGTTLTSGSGAFRFDNVEAGGYTLWVNAFGYRISSRFLVVEGNTTVTVSLEISPFLLDSLVVETRSIDVGGRVEDPDLGTGLADAYVVTSQRPSIRTGTGGRFRLENVQEEVPLSVSVRAFGYLQLDTIIVPVEDENYVFDLRADPVATRMIAEQVERIEERAARAPRSVRRRPMNRERLARWDSSTLLQVLEGEYSRRLRSVRCVIVDEWATEMPYRDVLKTMFPEEIERVEFLFNGQMLRVYTRRFMSKMVGGRTELRPALFVLMGRTPLCR